MPQNTETGAVASATDAAPARWPGEGRGRPLRTIENVAALYATRAYALDELSGMHRPWARSVTAATRRFNAQRDMASDRPRLFVAGDKLLAAGATPAELDELHALTMRELEDVQVEAASIRAALQRRINAEGVRRAALHGAAVAPPDPMPLADLLAQPDEDVTYRVADLWPVGGRILLAAQYKSGKSTLVGNVIRTLVDGGRLLGRFDTTPVERVALVDTELDPRTLRRWLRDQGIVRTDAVTVLPLRGAVSSFDLLDPTVRSQWAQRLAGADVVILDCLRPVLDALGLSEDKDAGRVLVAFDELLAEIGAGEGMVVTHMGHSGERARGDSRLLDWPDALWKIVRDGDESDDSRTAYIAALGRDVAVPEGSLAFDPETRHLTYEDGNRRTAADRTEIPLLTALVRAEPGVLSKRAAIARLQHEHDVPQRVARRTVEAAIGANAVVVTPGPHRASLLSPGPDPFVALEAGS
ncbi:AAA family ATPase [Tsukamurella sp. NPDC003166]|uniref:AAA family ATPase n=1 Tax=Tsukamurella sp. NPDC003166 TaxID=3154444 RepID=UPI0033BC5C94